MTLALRWRVPASPIITQWRGFDSVAQALAQAGRLGDIAAVISAQGPDAAQVAFDAGLIDTPTSAALAAYLGAKVDGAVFADLAQQVAEIETAPSSVSEQAIVDIVSDRLSAYNPLTASVSDIFAAFGIVPVIPEPTNTVLPAISGTAQEGFTLTATPGTWANSPLSVTGLWYRGSTATTRTGLTYVLASADIGASISYVETAISARTGASFVANSNPTAVVIAAAVAPPVNTVSPVVTGTNTVGSTLTTNNGTWTNSPTSYTYEWQRNGVTIAGATASTYVLVSADAGQSVRSRVTATNAGGATGVASSLNRSIVNPLSITGTPGTVQINVPYSFTPTVTGGSGTRTFALVGTLPSGLSFSTTTGTITGTATSVGSTSGLNITVSDPSGSPSASLGTFTLVRTSGGWDYGLARTPPYVTAWTRPASVAAGKANGSIPSNAIAFETGNAGGAFPATAAGLNAWLDACEAANLPAAIETSVVVGDLGRRRNNTSIYGAGSADVVIERNDRSTSDSGTGPASRRRTWLYSDKEDVVIRGINFKNFAGVGGVTYPTVPLVVSGSLDTSPYHSGGEATWESSNSNTGGPATTVYVRRLGAIVITGSVSISSVVIKRQIPATDNTGTTAGEKILDATWEASLESVTLFSGLACTTHAQVRDAINANSSTTGFSAELDRAGKVCLTGTSISTRAPIEVNVTKTGTGTVVTNNQTPAFEMSYSTLTDCNQGYMAVLDVLALGPIKLFKIDAPGTWNILSAPVTRWTDIWAANLYWRDCVQSRTPGTGRTDSRLPAGSSLSSRNTLIQLGSDNPVMMRYHGVRGGNTCLIENLEALNVESLNNTNTVNAAVLADVRNAWQVTANNRIIRFGYCKVNHLVGTNGAEDSNVFYGKLRGGTYLVNYMDDFGAAWVGASSVQDGSECAGILTKNPGSYYSTIAGVAAAGGGAEPEPIIYRGNTMINGPDGCPWLKSDENAREVWVDHNLFDGWDNIKGGVEQTAGNGAGLVRVTSHQYGPKVNSNRFRRCNPRSSTKRLINFWNLTAVGTVDGARWSVANNEFWNDVVTYTADTDLVTYNGPTSNNLLTNFVTGGNKVLSASGVDTGYKWLIRSEGGNAFPGTLAAASVPYGSIDFLAGGYGYMG